MDCANLTGTPDALKDLDDPRLDVRLRRLLERLLIDHQIHIRLVARRPVPAPVVKLGLTLLALPRDLRPTSVLGPAEWHAALGGGRITGFRDEPVVNARHHDHLHLGYVPRIGEFSAG